MCAQHDWVITSLACIDEECILHIAGGMIGREVQHLEVDLIGFHFAATCTPENPYPREYPGRGATAAWKDANVPNGCTSGQRDIKLFLFKGFRQRRGFNGFGAFRQSRFECHLDTVRSLPDRRPLLLGEFPLTRKRPASAATASNVCHTPGFERGWIPDRAQTFQRALFDLTYFI